MSAPPAALAAPRARSVWQWGRALLTAALAFGVIVTLFVASTGDWTLAAALPAGMLAVSAAVWLFRHPTLNLFTVLIGFVIVANNEAGFQLREIVYALYLYAALSVWLVRHVAVARAPLLRTRADWALGIFMVLLPCTLVLTLLFSGRFVGAVSELFSLSLLALYFPLKEVAARHRWGPKALVLTVMAVGMLVALRNFYEYWQMLGRVTQAWQVQTGRVVTNDNLLMVSALFSVVLVVYARSLKSFIAAGAGFFLCFGGLILTQSRGYWMAFFLGFAALVCLTDRRRRRLILIMGSVALGTMIGAGYLLVGSYMDLLLGGLVERILSIGTAVTQDLSLVNRFREAATVLDRIWQNPFIGYGMGVSYYFYDIAHQWTDFDPLVHNGYVGLWYKFGLWGLGLILFFWGRTLWQGLEAFQTSGATYWTRLCGLAAGISLIGFVLSTVTSNPFFLKDSLFIFSVTTGLAGGAYLRSRREVRDTAATTA